MIFVEESRQLLQDFIAPELRTLEARLAAVEAKLEARISTVESTMERNHKEVMDSLHRMEAFNLLSERLARVETKLQSVAS
jgi:polyhydroxyalkanoate synthesis regulator phasin